MKKSNIVLRNMTLLCLLIAVIPSVVSAALTRQLQIGSRGTDVSELQTFLASDTSVYPQGLVTGYFGSLTASAVRRFQAKNGISQVGRVGPQTMAAINSQMGGGGSSMLNQKAPAFTTLPVINIGSGSATAAISVNTDVPTRATLYYSTSPLVISENTEANPATVAVNGTAVRTNALLQTNHTINSLPLLSNTTYYFTVVATDANGRVSLTYPRWSFNSSGTNQNFGSGQVQTTGSGSQNQTSTTTSTSTLTL